MTSKLERDWKTGFLKRVEDRLPGCIILKNDSGYRQGIPDYIILHGPFWATLELKRSTTAKRQPNQPWYVETMDRMSFSAFVSPENEEEILDALQYASESR